MTIAWRKTAEGYEFDRDDPAWDEIKLYSGHFGGSTPRIRNKWIVKSEKASRLIDYTDPNSNGED